jgi:hypothetical protein
VVDGCLYASEANGYTPNQAHEKEGQQESVCA